VGVVAAVAALVAALVAAAPGRAAWDPDPLNLSLITDQAHRCAPGDLPETGIQGDVPRADQTPDPLTGRTRAEAGYNCGLALVGHTPLGGPGSDAHDGRPPTGNANMAVAGHCAYVAGPGGGVVPQTFTPPGPGNGVAVVDVSDPAHPRHVKTLRSPGAAATSETLHAVTTPEGRGILVVGRYGNDVVKTGPKPMDVYDVSGDHCADPVLMGTYDWPANIHNLTISPDGRYVFATIPLQAVDISGLWTNPDPTVPAQEKVVYLGNIQGAIDGPPVATGPLADVTDPVVQALAGTAAEGRTTHPQNMSHEAWPAPDFATNPDHKYLYVGGQTPQFELLTVIDLVDWLRRNPDGTPAGPPHVVSQQSGRGHSVRTATIRVDGKPRRFLLHSEESVFGGAYGCLPETANPFAGPAQPWLTDISDPAHPRPVSQFGLAINRPENCPAQLDSRTNQSVHYHDVDDPDDTTFVMASMWNAGLRIFDVRDPRRPTEVAYFNPGQVRLDDGRLVLDQAWAHSHYDAERGLIWLATANGGFWVLRLECQVIRYLGLRVKRPWRPCPRRGAPAVDPGGPGRTGVDLVVPAASFVASRPYYCTLAATLPA
jgi:hypothetical protein